MKKIYLALSIALISLGASAQLKSNFKPFKVDLGFGYAIPGGSGAKGGVAFSLEPKYAVASQIAVGLRMEGAVVARFSGYDQDGAPLNVSVKASGSYLVTGDYYYTNKWMFRPFTGVGTGIYSIASAEANSGGNGAAGAGSKFGGMARAGAEIGHFRFSVEYNMVPGSTLDGFDSDGNAAQITSKNSYLTVKIGAFFGGGRKK
jgi:hypothetical protein